MNDVVLPVLKDRLGISVDSRDYILCAIIDGIIDECISVHGIHLSEEKSSDILLVLDWATWKYNHPEDGVTPRSIRFRIQNRIIKAVHNESNMG